MNENERQKIKEAEMRALAGVHQDTIMAMRQGISSELSLAFDRGLPALLGINELLSVAMTALAETVPDGVNAEKIADAQFAVMKPALIGLINEHRAGKARV